MINEEYEFHPTLAARDEHDLPNASAYLGRALRARGAARHFHGVKSPGGVRRPVTDHPMRRRVVVVAQKIASGPTSARMLKRYINYLKREGVDADGCPGQLFDRTAEDLDGRGFVERSLNDPRHYRLVINPADGDALGDLKGYARQLMDAVQADLGQETDWIAAAHFNTDRPHLHVVVRGRGPDGSSLRINGAYLSGGLRAQAETVATDLLGLQLPRTAERDIQADRFTALDSVLVRATRASRLALPDLPATHRADCVRRLAYLEAEGHVGRVGPQTWSTPPDLRGVLMQVSQDKARGIAAAKAIAGGAWASQLSRMVPVNPEPGEILTGAFAGLSRAGRFPNGAQALALDLTDGRLGHLLLPDATSVLCLDRMPSGSVVQVRAVARSVRDADRMIAEVAASNGGAWSADAHRRLRPDDWPRFVAFHQKRLEAMTRAGLCDAVAEGNYAIPTDYCAQALRADVAQWGPAKLHVRLLDHRTLDEQVSVVGLTWLDRLMASEAAPSFSGPFGDQVLEALPERAKRLRMTGLGSGDPLRLSPEDIARLQIFEIKSAFEGLEASGKAAFMTPMGQTASGVYTGRVHVAGSPYAVLEAPNALHLMAWTPGMEACRGRAISAMVADGQVQFRAVRELSRGLGASLG